MKVSLLTIGDELLEGVIRNSNAEWLGAKLWDVGISLHQHSCVADNINEISQTLERLTSTSEVCVLSGGLGPTSDDVTRLAIAQALNTELITDQNAHKKLKDLGLDETRAERQAQRPRDAEAHQNLAGHAPILKWRMNDCTCFALPGVPTEFCAAFSAYIKPILYTADTYTAHTFECLNVGESRLARLVKEARVHDAVECRYQAAPPFTNLRLRSTNSAAIESATNLLKPKLTEYAIAHTGDALNKKLGLALRSLGWSISTAESCTSGLIAAELGRLEGASSFYAGSVCAYSNDVKINVLGVSVKTLDTYGAVSEACAREMAVNVRARLGTNVGLSVTGIAGPGGGSITKPVGTVCFGWSHHDETITETVQFRGNRASIRAASAVWSLNRCLEILRAHSQ